MKTTPNDIIAAAIASIGASVTVCDADMKLLYMNDKSRLSFGETPALGSSLVDCHKPGSVKIMQTILDSGKPHTYTITKRGVKKIIWQAPWKEKGKIAGLVEISIEIPETLPHFDRG